MISIAQMDNMLDLLDSGLAMLPCLGQKLESDCLARHDILRNSRSVFSAYTHASADSMRHSLLNWAGDIVYYTEGQTQRIQPSHIALEHSPLLVVTFYKRHRHFFNLLSYLVGHPDSRT
jgi:hypothetical protein